VKKKPGEKALALPRGSQSVATTLDDLKRLGFSPKEVGSLLGAAGSVSPSLLADNPRFREIMEIMELAKQVCGERAYHWFKMPEPRLGNVHPLTLLRDPENGPNLVKQTLYNSLRGSSL
jgi:hypothetical protein